MEESFAKYILEEPDWTRKMEIMYYLANKGTIYFDKSVILKTEIAKLFIEIMNIDDVDENTVLTACLLCNCKKPIGFTDMSRIKSYAKDGAAYLKKLGFSEEFCRICEGVNRYTISEQRDKESDILELVDNFGGMLLDRYDRLSFKPDEALLLLEYRNLKNKNNRYLDKFSEFIEEIQRVHIGYNRSMEYLSKSINESPTTKKALINAYNSEIDIKNALTYLRNKPVEPIDDEPKEIRIKPEEIDMIILRD